MLKLDARQQAMLEEMGIALPFPPLPEPRPVVPGAGAHARPPRLAAPAPVSQTPGMLRPQPASAALPMMATSRGDGTAQVASLSPPASAAPLPITAPGAADLPPREPAQHGATPTPSHAAPAAGAVDVALAPDETALSERARAIAQMDWPALAAAVAGCAACGLCRSRTHTVFGVGAEAADWMIIGEAPGENEDRQGEPFVGQAGKLLDRMLAALHLTRHAAPDRAHALYIANVLKCRPPRNRNPQPQETAQCEPYLKRQIALVQPRVILAMGRFAVQALLQTTAPIGRLRGSVHHYQGVPTIVTYHPAYLLRNPVDKGKSWADLCLAAATRAQPAPPDAGAH